MKLLNALMSEKFDPTDFNIAEIADLLAKTPMYAGFTQGCFYSFAQHNVRVSKFLGKAGHRTDLQLHALLHDVAETIASDRFRFKNLKDEKILNAIQPWLTDAVGLPPLTVSDEVSITWAHTHVGMADARDFLPPALAPFFKHNTKTRVRPVKPQPWMKAAESFQQHYRDIQTERGNNPLASKHEAQQ